MTPILRCAASYFLTQIGHLPTAWVLASSCFPSSRPLNRQTKSNTAESSKHSEMERKKRHSLGGFAPVLELGGGGGGDNRPKGGDLALFLGFWNTTTVEGDPSGCSQPPVDV